MVWASTYNSRLTKLIMLEKRALRVIARTSPPGINSEALFAKLQLLKLHQIKLLQIGTFMFSYNHSLLPSNFKNYFQCGSDIHTHYTRNSSKYRPPFAHLNSRRFSIKHVGPSVWNEIPTDLCQMFNLCMFKKSCALTYCLTELNKNNRSLLSFLFIILLIS